MKKSCLIYGAGGHARVVADALTLNGYDIAAFIDDHTLLPAVVGIPVQAYNPTMHKGACIIIGIGSNPIRQKIAGTLQHPSAIVIHPAAAVADDVVIGEGSVVLAQATLQTGTRIGRHVIINANVCIDHDAVIEDFAHIYPNSYIGGGAVVRSGVTIAPGTVVPRGTIVEADTKN